MNDIQLLLNTIPKDTTSDQFEALKTIGEWDVYENGDEVVDTITFIGYNSEKNVFEHITISFGYNSETNTFTPTHPYTRYYNAYRDPVSRSEASEPFNHRLLRSMVTPVFR